MHKEYNDYYLKTEDKKTMSRLDFFKHISEKIAKEIQDMQNSECQDSGCEKQEPLIVCGHFIKSQKGDYFKVTDISSFNIQSLQNKFCIRLNMNDNNEREITLKSDFKSHADAQEFLDNLMEEINDQ